MTTIFREKYDHKLERKITEYKKFLNDMCMEITNESYKEYELENGNKYYVYKIEFN